MSHDLKTVNREKNIAFSLNLTTDLEKSLIRKLKEEISPGAFICHHHEINKDDIFYNIGLTTPKLIMNRNKRPTIRFIPIRDVFSIKIQKKRNCYKIQLPTRSNIYSDFLMKQSSLISKAENALVSATAKKLIRLPKIQNGLNPFKEILFSLNRLQEIPINQINQRYKSKPWMVRKYLNFLSGMDYIVIEKEFIYPGNNLSKFDLQNQNGQDDILLMAELLENGLHFLKKEMKINILAPYLQLSNSYYLPAAWAGENVAMNENDIMSSMKGIYPRFKGHTLYQVANYMYEMTKENIFETKGDTYIGNNEVLQTYLSNFK